MFLLFADSSKLRINGSNEACNETSYGGCWDVRFDKFAAEDRHLLDVLPNISKSHLHQDPQCIQK